MAHMRLEDLEAANSENFDTGDSLSSSDPFDIITTKNVPSEHLRRWRKAVIARNYIRRFEYTLDFKQEEEMKQIQALVRSRVETIIDKHQASNAGHHTGPLSTTEDSPRRTEPESTNVLYSNRQRSLCTHCKGTGIGNLQVGEFGISRDVLVSITKDHSLHTLETYGGVDGLAKLLKTDLQMGVDGDDADLQKRRIYFGQFCRFPPLKEVHYRMARDLGDIGWAFLILVGYISLIINENKDGNVFMRSFQSSCVALMLYTPIIAFSGLAETHQITKLVNKKEHVLLEAIRGGRRVTISWRDIVVGDVVPFEIGDQILGDGILISSHSLAVDMLTLTGESKIVYKDSKNPFLMAGCTVTNGKGTMLVTSVGRCTLWGYLIEHKPFNIGEETALEVRLNGLATFIAKAGCIISSIVFLTLLVKLFTSHTYDNDGHVQFEAGQTNGAIAVRVVVDILFNMIAMVFLTIPEELPRCTTRMLAHSMGKILADNALIRRQSALETMGWATTICIGMSDILIMTKDTCNQGLKALVEVCHDAGVKICILTDDSLQATKAISLECATMKSHAHDSELMLVKGVKILSSSDLERQKIADKITVMACSSPSDKLFLVKALKKQGEVVAMIGCTSEDASAMNEADVGIGMGKKVSQIAKESSDVIILDNDFDSIVKLVRWGRTMYANIQKSIDFQLTVIIAALLINLLSAIFWGGVQLNVVQLLWVNFMVDMPGALIFVTEPPTNDLMRKPPVGRRKHLITNVMRWELLIQICYQVSAFLVLKIWGRSLLDLGNDATSHPNKVTDTMIFNSFVLCQISNSFNTRKPYGFNIFKGINRNKRLMWFTGLTLIFQVVIIFFLGSFFDTVKLNSKQWIISIIIAFISWPLAVIGKLITLLGASISQLFKGKPING